LPPEDLLLALLEDDEELELEEVRPPLGILLREEMTDEAVALDVPAVIESLGELPLRLW